MKQVSYFPYSRDLTHPGDRRRIKIWSEEFGIPLKINDASSGNILVLSAASSLKRLTLRHQGPVVIDLVDGYLSTQFPIVEDIGRNSIRAILNKSSLMSITFSRELKFAVMGASAVVVSSPEQAKYVEKFNVNVHCILDDHSELMRERVDSRSKSSNQFTLIWEGMGYTLKHLIGIAEQLEQFILERDARLLVVSHAAFYRYAARFGRTDTLSLLRKSFGRVWKKVEFIDWSIENLQQAANRADVALIPIQKDDKFALAKPENKLLSFWTMGIPALCSRTKAYDRVLNSVGHPEFLVSDSRWLQSLNEFFHKTKVNPSLSLSYLGDYVRYLDSFHTRGILAKKWDRVLRPLM